MESPANDILNGMIGSGLRIHRPKVESLVRLKKEQYPDTAPLTTRLLTTLDLEEMLRLYRQELERHLPVDSIAFHNQEHRITVHLGTAGRHNASYGLNLHEEHLGDLRISRNRRFAEQELAIIEQLLVTLLYPIRNGLRHHMALAAAFRDPLTGVSNRAAMEQALPRELELSLRHKLDLCMLIVDLDHFKGVNDHFGHAAGDQVLQGAAHVMAQSTRSSDMVFRFGGEEFVILLPATDLDGAQVVAERIRENIEQHVTLYSDKELRITSSIGVSIFEEGDNLEKLFKRADERVYRAKALGRNRVVCHEE